MKIKVPTLLVGGLGSDVASDASVTGFQRHLPTLEVFDVSGASHMVAGDGSDAFNEDVIQFLTRCMPPEA